MPEPLEIVAYSDFLCPWCYNFTVRMRRLEDEFGDRIRIHWHTYLLRPERTPEISRHGRAKAHHPRTVSPRISSPRRPRHWIRSPHENCMTACSRLISRKVETSAVPMSCGSSGQTLACPMRNSPISPTRPRSKRSARSTPTRWRSVSRGSLQLDWRKILPL